MWWFFDAGLIWPFYKYSILKVFTCIVFLFEGFGDCVRCFHCGIGKLVLLTLCATILMRFVLYQYYNARQFPALIVFFRNSYSFVLSYRKHRSVKIYIDAHSHTLTSPRASSHDAWRRWRSFLPVTFLQCVYFVKPSVGKDTDDYSVDFSSRNLGRKLV